MKTLTIVAAFLSVAALAHVADAAPKRSHKPSVCADFEIADTKGGRIGVCYDGKNPVVYNMFSVVDVNAGDEESPTKTVRVMVGWR